MLVVVFAGQTDCLRNRSVRYVFMSFDAINMRFFVADSIFGCKGTVIPCNKIEEYDQIRKNLLQKRNISPNFS